MKPLSDKFAALRERPSGIARRVGSEVTLAPVPVSPALRAEVEKLASTPAAAKVKRSRAKSSKYRDYQKNYMRKRRAKLKEEME